jgi:hypothetical protein
MHSKDIFYEYEVKFWEDCRSLLKSVGDWVFRGQSNSTWTLQTTFERGYH